MRRVLLFVMSLVFIGALWGCSNPASRGESVQGERTASVEERTEVLAGYNLLNAPAAADPGASIPVDWIAPTAHSVNDWIGLFQAGALDDAYVYSIYVGTPGAGSGSTSLILPQNATGSWELRYFLDNGYTLAATFSPIAVNVVTTDTVSGPAAAAPGSTVTASWTAPTTHSVNDWIGLFQVGAAPDAYVYSVYVGAPGVGTGSASLTMPQNATGSWEFRYYTNNGYNLGATSGAIDIYTVSGPATADPGTAVAANWTAPVTHSANDWIGLFQVGAAPDAYVYSAYVGASGIGTGTASLLLPNNATGSWEFRYFLNNGYTLAATSGAIAVNSVPVDAISGPNTAVPGATVTANWTAPTTHSVNDWIGLYQANAPDNAYVASVYVGAPGQTSGAASLVLPSNASGSWEFRYFQNNGYTLGATSGAISVSPVLDTVAGPSSAAPGSMITATWTAPADHSVNDWIGLYQVNAPDNAYVTNAYVGAPGQTSGIVELILPQNATGSWELRYFQNNGYTLGGTSTPILAQ